MNKHILNMTVALIGLSVCLLVGVHGQQLQMAAAYTAVSVVVYLLRDTHLMQRPAGLMGCDEPTLADVISKFNEARVELEKRQKGLDEAHTLVQKSIEEGKTLVSDTKQRIDEQIASVNEQKAQLNELMQKMDEVKKQTKAAPTGRTVRTAMLEALEGKKEQYESFKSRDTRSLRLDLKAITTTDGAVGLLPFPTMDTMVSMARQPLRIRNLLTIVPVTTDSVRYAQQTLRTNAARIVAEGTAKPYSAYKWENQTATVEVIAHLAKMTLQALADAPRLAAEVESEMRFGLDLVEEQEILNGDGSAGHLSGLMHNATAYALPAGIVKASRVLNKVDVLRAAQLQLAMSFAPADAQVLSMADWADIELLRDSQERYIFGSGPGNTAEKKLWNLPVIDSASMAVDNFLIGAFGYSAHLYDRQQTAVLISTENDTDFEDNQATMRCEKRMGLGVRRPEGLVKGTFTAALA